MNEELALFYKGSSFTAYRYFGAHFIEKEGKKGVLFRVFAPRAQKVELIGEFDAWQGTSMLCEQEQGVYSLFVPEVEEGMMYKYRILSRKGGVKDKTDPYGFETELRPGTASIVREIDGYQFNDETWMKKREKNYNKPMNIYELHFGSWRKKGEEEAWYSYEELCETLISYVKANHFTHIEFLPLSEHPLDASWGYQVSGYFSVTSRYGTAKELKYLVDQCHQHEIGVIMDFVPVHFVGNDFALAQFDGTALYEYEPSDVTVSEWGSCNFNYYRQEVCSFLQSAAHFWLEVFHFDGLRMDAISNALYWQGDSRRGINPGAVDFLKRMNVGLGQRHQGIMLIAEDSTHFPKVTARTEYGGLGFDYKWNMGWMNDTLKFFALPPEERHKHYHQITFSMDYFYNELFLLPLSHDEVVHGKKAILDKMWGSYEQKFAQCKTLYTYMFTHPGKKLNFMGNEIGHFREWDENQALDWFLLEYPMHDGFHTYFRELGKLYQELPALYEGEYHPAYFKYLVANDQEHIVYAYERGSDKQKVVVVINLSDQTYEDYKIKFSEPITLHEMINSEDVCYGGCGKVNSDIITVKEDQELYSVSLYLPPFSSCILEITKE